MHCSPQPLKMMQNSLYQSNTLLSRVHAVSSQQRRQSTLGRNTVPAKVDCRRNPPPSGGRRHSNTGGSISQEAGTPLAMRGFGEQDLELVEQLRRDIIDTCAHCSCVLYTARKDEPCNSSYTFTDRRACVRIVHLGCDAYICVRCTAHSKSGDMMVDLRRNASRHHRVESLT